MLAHLRTHRHVVDRSRCLLSFRFRLDAGAPTHPWIALTAEPKYDQRPNVERPERVHDGAFDKDSISSLGPCCPVHGENQGDWKGEGQDPKSKNRSTIHVDV